MKQLIFKLAFILQTFLINYQLKAETQNSKEILIEIGEDYKIQNIKSKLWIENPSILKAQSQDGSVKIKPLSVGKSNIKIDQKIIPVYVLPTQFKNSFEYWKNKTKKTPHLEVDFCENTICLKGYIKDFSEFEKIMKDISKNKNFIFLKLDIAQDLQNEVEKWYIQYFRQNELTPPKILFTSNPWKAVLSHNLDNKMNQKMSHEIGLLTQESQNKLDIQDNIKVSVKFIEVKKSLKSKIGISWPEGIDGQISSQVLELNDSLKILLNLNESGSDTEILASPNLVCRSGKEAQFFAGGEIPISSQSIYGSQVTWKNYGIVLKVKPLVDPLGQMSLEVESEISAPNFDQSKDGLPAIHSNKFKSHFDLVKSKTIVISGLVQNSWSKNDVGLPYLTRIPVIGRLFGSRDFKENKSELIILVTPEIYGQ